jgi:hypothetical protein
MDWLGFRRPDRRFLFSHILLQKKRKALDPKGGKNRMSNELCGQVDSLQAMMGLIITYSESLEDSILARNPKILIRAS